MVIARRFEANDRTSLRGVGCSPCLGEGNEPSQYSHARTKTPKTMAVRHLALVSVLPMLATASCCPLARLLCGPDRTEWVSVAFDQPERTLATLLAAIRRDRADVIYQCLGEDYKKQQGVDGLVMEAAWTKLKAQVPGIHLAGYAKIPPPSQRTDAGATFDLDVEGNRLTVELVRQWRVTVVYRRDGGVRSPGQYVSSIEPFLQVAAVDSNDPGSQDRSRITLKQPVVFSHPGLDQVSVDQIDRLELCCDWKVARLSSPNP